MLRRLRKQGHKEASFRIRFQERKSVLRGVPFFRRVLLVRLVLLDELRQLLSLGGAMAEEWEAASTIAELYEAIKDCGRCPLGDTRTNLVLGTGDEQAEIMFVGEAPGFHEDRQGIPFVGPAGQLLDQLLGSIGLERSQVYIANTLKCRPPENRDPNRRSWRPARLFFKQIELIGPRIICTLGNHATKTLLVTNTGSPSFTASSCARGPCLRASIPSRGRAAQNAAEEHPRRGFPEAARAPRIREGALAGDGGSRRERRGGGFPARQGTGTDGPLLRGLPPPSVIFSPGTSR